MRIILKLTAIAFLLSSCHTKNAEFKDKTGATLQIGKVYKNIKGLNDSTLNYSAYFPKTIDKKTNLSVLFLLDPHAEGYTPVNLYKSLADKYNYLLVGSNNSRNGMAMKEFNKHLTSLISEVKKRYPIAENAMFAGGFSGGAKMAIFCAEQFPEIIGAVACGASLSKPIDSEPNYYFAGIVGNKDFNYLEMRQSFAMFDRFGFDYTSTIFDGRHQWAPLEAFETAFVGFDIYQNKRKSKVLEKEAIEGIRKKLQDSVLVYAEQNRILDAYEMLQQEKRWFYGLAPIVEVQKQIIQITQSSAFKQQIQKRQQAITQEIKLRSEFVKALETNDIDWWKIEYEKIKKPTQNTEINLVKERLLNYVSMLSFMLIKTNIENNELPKAEKKLEIYKLIDSQNPDVYLMYAYLYLLNNDKERMQESLKKAKQIGLKSFETYANEPFWKKLFQQKQVKKIFNK